MKNFYTVTITLLNKLLKCKLLTNKQTELMIKIIFTHTYKYHRKFKNNQVSMSPHISPRSPNILCLYTILLIKLPGSAAENLSITYTIYRNLNMS